MTRPCFALQVRSQSIQAAWRASCALRAEIVRPQFQLANISVIFHRLVLIKAVVSVVRQKV
jgi:hypothetical protein